MIKKFEQYIKETLNLKSFKFENNFQALFDMFEDDIDIDATDNKIIFLFHIPRSNIGKFQEFNNNIFKFTAELKIVLDSLKAEKIKNSITITTENNLLELEIVILNDAEEFIDYLYIDRIIDNLGYDLEYFMKDRRNAKWQSIFSDYFEDENPPKYLKIIISQGSEDEFDIEIIDKEVITVFNRFYKISKKEIKEESNEFDELFQIYEIQLDRI